MRTKLALALCTAVLPSVAQARPPVGWRSDGSGSYPKADPPTAWSTTRNVVWKTPLPGRSNASPVLVGEKIFVCAEPDLLLCAATQDGRVLWQRHVKLSDTWTEADRKLAEAKQKQTEALRKKHQELDDEINRVFAARKKDPKNQELRKRFKDLRHEQREAQKQMSRNARWASGQTERTNGYTSSTPVSDGAHVWALFGTGVAACFDLAGDRKWIRFIERPNHPHGHSASPVLADGKLLVFVRKVTALDPLSGKVLWVMENSRRGWGTPFITQVGTTTVAVTAKGQIVRVADGKLLAQGAGYLEYASPVVADGVAYHLEGGARATRLVPAADGVVKTERVWKATLKKARYYASPVLLDGLLYVVNQRNTFYVIHAATGEIAKSEKLPLGRGENYPSVTLAGRHLYVSSDNGATLVIEPGKGGKIIATNKLEYFRSTPVFQGERMYVRTWKHLFCIGK